MGKPLAYWLLRARNGARKVAAGLTPRGESVWPGVRNDLFVAHESIYHFFARHVAGERVLDAGCGAGYGSTLLLEAGAREVLGVDLDRRNVRYARRRYARAGLRFEVADCERLRLEQGSLGAVVTSNMLEHLERPERFLGSVREALVPGGRLWIAVPPITSRELLEQNLENPFHRSNKTVDEWLALFAAGGWRAETYRHLYRGPRELDFASPRRSEARVEDFEITAAGREELYREPTLSAIFSLEVG